MVQKKKKDRSGIRYIVRLTQPAGSRESGVVPAADESLRLRWIRQKLQDLVMDVWVPYPRSKGGFHKWVEQNKEIVREYQLMIDRGWKDFPGGKKAWTNFVLGDEVALRLRRELRWLKAMAETSHPDPKITSLWEMVKDMRLVQEYREYEPDHTKYWAILSQKQGDLREEDHWHRADDGTMEEDKPLPGIQIPYRYGSDGQPEQFIFRTIRKTLTGMQVWVDEVKAERKEKMLGIYYRKGVGPAIPYQCLGINAEKLFDRGNMEGARKLYDAYMTFKIAMNQRSVEIKTALCGKVHVHWLQVGDLCLWSPIVAKDRVAKTKPPSIPDEFYNQ